jgi:hypothetical protein
MIDGGQPFLPYGCYDEVVPRQYRSCRTTKRRETMLCIGLDVNKEFCQACVIDESGQALSNERFSSTNEELVSRSMRHASTLTTERYYCRARADHAFRSCQ